MESDIFSTFNQYLRTLPGIYSEVTYIILLIMYSHLILGSWIERHKLKKQMKLYLFFKYTLMMFYLCIKAVDIKYSLFDGFLPIYIMFYTDGLIGLKSNGLNRCKTWKQTIKKLTTFKSKLT